MWLLAYHFAVANDINTGKLSLSSPESPWFMQHWAKHVLPALVSWVHLPSYTTKKASSLKKSGQGTRKNAASTSSQRSTDNSSGTRVLHTHWVVAPTIRTLPRIPRLCVMPRLRSEERRLHRPHSQSMSRRYYHLLILSLFHFRFALLSQCH